MIIFQTKQNMKRLSPLERARIDRDEKRKNDPTNPWPLYARNVVVADNKVGSSEIKTTYKHLYCSSMASLFHTRMENRYSRNSHYFELLEENQGYGSGLRCYLDIEWMKDFNRDLSEVDVHLLVDDLILYMQTVYLAKNKHMFFIHQDYVIYLDSSNDIKFSHHVIIPIYDDHFCRKEWLFKDTTQVKHLIDSFFEEFPKSNFYLIKDKDGNETEMIDRAVYHPDCQLFRIVNCTKISEPERPLVFTPKTLLNFEKHQIETPLHRFLMSLVQYEAHPVLKHDQGVEIFEPRDAEKKKKKKISLSSSSPSSILVKKRKKEDKEDKEDKKRKEIGDIKIPENLSEQQQKIIKFALDNALKEYDLRIASVRPGGTPNIFFLKTENDFRLCKIKQAEHQSNHIYFIYNHSFYTLSQRCHDYVCARKVNETTQRIKNKQATQEDRTFLNSLNYICKQKYWGQ